MGMISKYHVFGVDGGGTGCRIALYTSDGQQLAVAHGGPANFFTDPEGSIENVLAAVSLATNKAGLPETLIAQSVAHIGLAGVMDAADSATFAAAMPFHEVSVSDDRATSVAGALGDADGILAAIGTGTIVAAQDNKDVRYFGGWGHQLADQASGGWLGHEALRRAALAFDGLAAQTDMTQQLLKQFGGTPVGFLELVKNATPGDYASLAPMILDAARADDAHAVALMQEGAGYLMSCIEAVGDGPGARLCLSGGIGPLYASYLAPEIQSIITPPDGTALDGAVHLARQLLAAKGDAT